MAVVAIAGKKDGSGCGHSDAGSNTLPSGAHWQFLWDNTQVLTITQVRQIAQALEAMARSNKAFTP